MTDHIPEVVSWCLVAVVLAVLLLLVRQRQITARLAARHAALQEDLRTRDEELQHLLSARLPAISDSATQPMPVPGLREERLVGTAFAQHLQGVADLFARAVERAQTRADISAKAALKASMRALQALANEQQVAISEMQDRHDNPDVLRDLLEIDHANAQFGRRAQAIAVLCGSWPGRQRASSPLLDVVRGAKSRIRDYRRVEVDARVDIAVVSRAVEPVVLAVAELLDNAARHSQPNTQVEVTLQPAHHGACVVIDDAGVGMDGQEVERATELLSGQRPVDVARLGDPPQFGFTVIGMLASRYGFTVSVDTRSPYGGVRAVVFLPGTLLTHLTPDEPKAVPKATAPQPVVLDREGAADGSAAEPTAAMSHPPVDDEPAPTHGVTPGGLPKRRRRRAAPTPARPAGDASQAPDDEPSGAHRARPEPQRARSAEETARRMGAFARGTRTGRADREDAAAPHHDEGKGRA